MSLPEELIEKISTYLDLNDLKILTQTCKYLNEVSWFSLGEIAAISIKRILSYADIETFTKSKRIYQNVKLNPYYRPHSDFESRLNQLSSIPSIKLRHVTLNDFCNTNDLRTLKNYGDEIRTITTPVDVENMAFKAEEIKSIFPKVNIIFQPRFGRSSAVLNFEEVNFQSIVYREEDDFNAVTTGLTYFKNLKHLEIATRSSSNFKILETIIENNKVTLRKLEIGWLKEPWNYQLPCQLRELSLRCDNKDDHKAHKLLENQSHLRKLDLANVLITNELLDVLSKKPFLTIIQFNFCHLELSLDCRKFEFLRNRHEISSILRNCDLQDPIVINAIIDNSENLTRLKLSANEVNDEKIFSDFKPKVLKNLKFLEVNNEYLSNYVLKRIKTPNLEICIINCYSEFLLECKLLRTLEIQRKITHGQVVNILEALKCLETLSFIMDATEFVAHFPYVLDNRGNIKHLTLDLRGSRILCVPDLMESYLRGEGIKYTQLESHYQFETFSLEIVRF